MDPVKNLVVFAPAGSGKTERLSNRYIELLHAGVEPGRILTLTFTEKAAAEMKERIFQRLEERDPERYRSLRRDALKMRVSTIHAFCLELVRRFAPALGLDPRIEVLPDPSEQWQAAKYDTLMRIAESERAPTPAGRDTAAFDLLLELITGEDRPGWPGLARLYDEFFKRRVKISRGLVRPVDRDRLARARDELKAHPLCAELADLDTLLPDEFSPASENSAIQAIEAQREGRLNKDDGPRRKGQDDDHFERNQLLARYYSLLRQDRCAIEFARRFELFSSRFLAAYTNSKRAAGQVDYDDMESLALKLLNTEPDWQNVLRAFDEHTDHLLVDEFQDTSYLQWGIIDKLTEEWRSGEGVKQARNVEPTVFLVGDDKQSIYMFRDAKVEVFRTAADKLRDWLGPGKLTELTLEDNYRSLGAIIDFTNALFSALMSPTGQTGPTRLTEPEPWRTRYAPFRRARKNDSPGRVEILLDPCEGGVAEHRARDAANVCRRILALLDPADPLAVHERDETSRPCRPGDIAILIRSRTLLPALEEQLHAHRIPFLVGRGTGFYAETEVRYCIALLAALVDPADGLALYATLRGPVFDIEERDLFLASSGSGLFLLDRLRAAPPGSPVGRAVAAIDEWRKRLRTEPLARVIEDALAGRKVWEKSCEPQRHANLRKLLRLVEDRQAAGEGPLRILRALDRDAGKDEAKADVRPEGLDAVQVMTVHSAKGLQFPVVFLPGLDESIKPMREKSGQPLVIEEVDQETVLVSWLPEAGLRRDSEFHMDYRLKEIEEEKRVFYAACTRARDALFLTGTLHKKAEDNSRLGWLVEALGLEPGELRLGEDLDLPGTTVRAASEIPVLPPLEARTREKPHRAEIRAVKAPPAPVVKPMSRHLPSDLLRRRPELLGMGDVIHELLEAISTGRLTPDSAALDTEARRLLARRGLPAPDVEAQATEILGQLEGLKADAEAWSIIAPRPTAEAELPLMYSDGETVFSGRADRVIFDGNEIRVYDYKTFPVTDAEIPDLAREYHDNQLFHYAAAQRRMHEGRKVRTFLVFTARPLIVETG